MNDESRRRVFQSVCGNSVSVCGGRLNLLLQVESGRLKSLPNFRARAQANPVRSYKNLTLFLSVFLLLAIGGMARAQQEPIPVDKAGWIKRLSKITEPQNDDWNALYRFRNLDPEMAYAIIKELWGGKISPALISPALKCNILQNFASDYGEFTVGTDGLPISSTKISSHLLDILDLGAADANEDTRRAALNMSYTVAVHAFDTPDEYQAWRRATPGRPIADLARENYRSLFERFIQANYDAKVKMLGQVTRLSFSSGTYGTSVGGKEIHGVLAHGLTGIRRQMAQEMGLLDAMGVLLKPRPVPPAKNAPDREQTVRQVLYFFMSFTPAPSFLQKIEPDVQTIFEARQSAKAAVSYETVWFLQNYNTSRWATDILLKIVEEHYPGDYPWMLTNALCARDDPRVIPALIAVLEDCGAGEDQTITNALVRLTGAKPDADSDADWWRLWRRKNADKFPPDVAAPADSQTESAIL